MSNRLSKTLKAVLPCSALLLFAACENERPPVLSEVDPGTYTPPRLNVQPGVLLFDNAPIQPGGTMTLVWSDEFDGAALDPATWLIQTGDGTDEGIPGWGNNELQYYQEDNVTVANGMLVIEAREESVGGLNYTSARITTQDRVAFRYGRIEASIRLPGGQGTWPAFWMLSQDSPYGEWAARGEIDIMEADNLGVGGKNDVFVTLHYGGEAPANRFSSETHEVNGSATAEFHEYAVEWDPSEIRWYIDGELKRTEDSWFSSAAPYPAPFDQAFHILLNAAVGGNVPGPPDATTVFPVTMEVDYVRVYSGAP